MKARQEAIKSLLKYLHRSEADRFKPQEEAPAPAPEAKDEMAPETLEALQALCNSGE